MIVIASDHAGLELKQLLMKHLEERGIAFKDIGTYTPESCHYPLIAASAARGVADGTYEKGILVCGTGIGMSIAANKIHGVRCAHCSDVYSAEKSREHNDANMIALGGRVVGQGLAEKIVDAFLDTEFLGGRHADRVQMMMELENS